MSRLMLIVGVLIICLGLISYTQYQRISILKKSNQSLIEEVGEFKTANDNLLAQYKLINEALSYAAQQKEAAEKNSSTLRNRLKLAQSSSECSSSPVPNDVIRMQREAITETNNKFTHP